MVFRQTNKNGSSEQQPSGLPTAAERLESLLSQQEQRRRDEAVESAKRVPPEILQWARDMRDVFGPGVRLMKGTKWPGGNDTENAKLKARKRK